MKKAMKIFESFELVLSKNLKKIGPVFSFEPSLWMDKIFKNKGNLELVTSCSSGYKTKNSFIGDVLPDQVWWSNLNKFCSHSKNYCFLNLFLIKNC